MEKIELMLEKYEARNEEELQKMKGHLEAIGYRRVDPKNDKDFKLSASWKEYFISGHPTHPGIGGMVTCKRVKPNTASKPL